MTLLCTDDFVGVKILIMGKDTHSWAGSLQPKTTGSLGSAAESLFNRLVNDYGLRDINSI